MGTQVELVQVGSGKRVVAASDEEEFTAFAASSPVSEGFSEMQMEYLSLIAASEVPPIHFPAAVCDSAATALHLLKTHRDSLALSCSPAPSSATAAADLQELLDGTFLSPTLFPVLNF
jgi:hypothetical protein